MVRGHCAGLAVVDGVSVGTQRARRVSKRSAIGRRFGGMASASGLQRRDGLLDALLRLRNSHLSLRDTQVGNRGVIERRADSYEFGGRELLNDSFAECEVFTQHGANCAFKVSCAARRVPDIFSPTTACPVLTPI